MSIFEQYPICTWKVGSSKKLAIPVLSIQEGGGNRIVKRTRPYRNGNKLDDTGSRGKEWTIRALFENSIEEEGLDPNSPLYPNVLNELIASFDIHETGDLVLPTRGTIRCRAETYTREETAEDRDGAMVSFTFWHDNEDNVDVASFQAPGVQAVARRLAQTTTFDAQSAGAWDASLGELQEFASQLEAYATFPGDTVADIDSQASIVVASCNRVGRTWERESEENNNLLADPELSTTQRKLQETEDLAGRVRAEAGRGRPRMVPLLVPGNTNLFAVAASVGQDAADILAINSGLNALMVPAGTVVRVFEQA